MKTLPKKHRAVLRYTSLGNGIDGHGVALWKRDSLHKLNRGDPHYLIPATPKAYEAQVEAMAWKLATGVAKNDQDNTWNAPSLRWIFRDQAMRALTALGIRRPKKGTK